MVAEHGIGRDLGAGAGGTGQGHQRQAGPDDGRGALEAGPHAVRHRRQDRRGLGGVDDTAAAEGHDGVGRGQGKLLHDGLDALQRRVVRDPVEDPAV